MTDNGPLTPRALIGDAQEATGLEDFGEDAWREGLDRLVASLRREGGLTPVGVEVAAAMLRDQLKNRLWVTEWHRREPSMGAAAVPAPVVVLGMPRTGTTIVFDLLAQDPRFRAPLTWEVAQPNPPPETATFETDPRIEESAASIAMLELLNPGFQAVHPAGAQRAQECVSIYAADFRSLLFSIAFHVPSYTRWVLWDADMSSAYRYHRQFLQLLQWHHPGERWLLKTPAHQWCLADLFAAYPDATIVQTHRDPLKVIASTASLGAHLQAMGRDQPTVPELAAEWADYLAVGGDRSVDGREDGTVPAGRAVDIQFRDFMAAPFAAIGQVYAALGIPFEEKVESAMRRFLADNAADKHGVHRYTFAATGLDVEATRSRTERYERYFNVPREEL